MAAAGITKWKERVASMQRSATTQRQRRKTDAIKHTIVATGASYAMGAIERSGTTAIPTILGLDHKLTWAGLFAAIATSSSGKVADTAAAIADGLFACYGYAQGLGTGYTIKGEDDFDI